MVRGQGNREAGIFVVGEAPGREEDEGGIPFIGKAGQVLNACIREAGLRREDLWISNTICCRPPNNDLRQAPDALLTCPPLWLLPEIERIDPPVVVALGLTAGRLFFGNITRAHEIVERVRRDKKRIIVAGYHPSYFLRGKEKWVFDSIVRTLKIAKEFSSGEGKGMRGRNARID